MKIYLKIIILTGLFLLSTYFLLEYLNSNYWEVFKIKYFKMVTILSFSAFFITLMFLIPIKLYRQIWGAILVIALTCWLFIYFYQGLADMKIDSKDFWNFWDALIIFTYSIVGPGLLLYTIHYIEKKSAKFENARLFGKYHIHEGFAGIVLLIFAGVLYPIRLIMKGESIFHNELIFLFAIVHLLLYAFILFGTFLTVRDWRDVIHLKLIEKKERRKIEKNDKNIVSIFSLIQKEEIPFFEIFKVVLYPIGIILTSISINAIVFGSTFLPKEIFNLDNEMVINLGLLLVLIAGGMLGLDWVRLFRRFCPEQYLELKKALDKLKSQI